MLQHLNAFLVVRGPKLKTVLFFTHYLVSVLKAGPKTQSLLGTKPHWYCCVLLLKTADFNSASVQCCNCTVKCKTTNNRRRKSLSNPADKFPELQSCSYSTLGKNQILLKTFDATRTQVHISFSDLNLRACLCCTLLLKSEAAYPHQCDSQTNDCFLKRIIPGQRRHMVLGSIVVVYGAVLDTCTSICGC